MVSWLLVYAREHMWVCEHAYERMCHASAEREHAHAPTAMQLFPPWRLKLCLRHFNFQRPKRHASVRASACVHTWVYTGHSAW